MHLRKYGYYDDHRAESKFVKFIKEQHRNVILKHVINANNSGKGTTTSKRYLRIPINDLRNMINFSGYRPSKHSPITRMSIKNKISYMQQASMYGVKSDIIHREVSTKSKLNRLKKSIRKRNRKAHG